MLHFFRRKLWRIDLLILRIYFRWCWVRKLKFFRQIYIQIMFPFQNIVAWFIITGFFVSLGSLEKKYYASFNGSIWLVRWLAVDRGNKKIKEIREILSRTFQERSWTIQQFQLREKRKICWHLILCRRNFFLLKYFHAWLSTISWSAACSVWGGGGKERGRRKNR